MKIAYFSDIFYPELSGISDSILLVGTELANRGHSIEYFVPKYSRLNYKLGEVDYNELSLHPNIKIHRISSLSYPSPTLQGRVAIPNPLRGFLTKEKFDIVHSHTFLGVGIDALLFSKIKDTLLLGTNHTLIEAFARYSPIKAKFVENLLSKYLIWYYNRCGLVTSPSKFLLRDMVSKGLRAPTATISNIIEDQFFDTTENKKTLKEKFGFSPFTILYAGRLSQEKNTEIMVDAFMDICQDIPDAELVLVGQGVLRKKIESMVHNKNLAARIKILGPFIGSNKDKLYDVFHASDIFVMPSTSETQSMATLQAMASGLPVIAANSGPLPEIVTKESGLLFEPGDKIILKKQITYLYREREKGNQMGQNGKLFAKQFSQKEITDKWEIMYAECLSGYKNKKTCKNIK